MFRAGGVGAGKKKDLIDEATGAQEREPRSERESFLRGVFDQNAFREKGEPFFAAPETQGTPLDLSEDEVAEIAPANAWDVAVRYHEFKASPRMKRRLAHLRRISAEAILQRAQEILGSLVHPMDYHSVPLSELPGNAEQADIDLDETLDASPMAVAGMFDESRGKLRRDIPLTQDDIWMSYTTPRKQAIVLTVDTSLSMTGEKLALTAVALAVVLLQFPEDPIGIVAFESQARLLKRPEERASIRELVERFLDVPAQGYTHLEDGMRAALTMVRNISSRARGRPPATVLLTDGKYTAGRDPSFLAPRFPHLAVLKMGSERASLGLCRELARRGRGSLREVSELDALPDVMYGLVKDLLRGRSFA